jgi:hypothetical protein
MLQELSTAAGGVPNALDDDATNAMNSNTNKNGGLVEFEVAQLCSLCPETADEAIALIPSLARIQEDDLDKILADIANFRKFK